MDRLKRIMKSAMDNRSSRFMLGTIALGVVVALLAGTLIGYKLDNSKSNSAKKTTAAVTKKKKKTKKGNSRAVARPLLVGRVVASRPAKISVVAVNGKRVPILVGPRTKAETAGAASAASIVVGSKVLYAPTTAGASSAAEVVVLPGNAGIGSKVFAVSPGLSMTLAGKHVITTRGATVLRTVPSSRRRIPVGTKVVVAYFSLKGKNGAVDVALLPATSKL
jgi:hypothetical protein